MGREPPSHVKILIYYRTMGYYEQLLLLSFTVGDTSNPLSSLSDRSKNLKKILRMGNFARKRRSIIKKF